MIGTDENRAVLYVEVTFWSGKRKAPPSLVSGKYRPHFVVKGTADYLGVCFLDGSECAFDEPALGNAQPLYPDTVDYSLTRSRSPKTNSTSTPGRKTPALTAASS